MSTELFASLVAFIGVILSAIIAYLTSLRQSKIEAKKHLIEIKNGFSEKIFEKRLSIYPDLFELLSNFQKNHVETNSFSQQVFENLLKELLILDSKARILFSGNTGRITYQFRLMVAEKVQQTDYELKEFYNISQNRNQLKAEIDEYQVALKNELGIYAFENPLVIKKLTDYKLYGRSAIRS